MNQGIYLYACMLPLELKIRQMTAFLVTSYQFLRLTVGLCNETTLIESSGCLRNVWNEDWENTQ